MKNRRLKVITLLSAAWVCIGGPVAHRAAAKEGGIYCRYEKIAVPCKRLSRSHRVDERKMLFKPLKAIPIWPNVAIFGGKDEAYDEKSRLKDSFYNRTAKAPLDGINDIERIDVSGYEIGKNFVDSWFYVPEYTDIFDIRSVFLGPEIFALWMEASKSGVICGESHTEDGTAIKVSDCAFVRIRASTKRLTTWEYCTFQRHVDSGVQVDPDCTDVAEDDSGTKRVMASAYTYDGGDLGYGGGEGEFECSFTDIKVADLIPRTEAFVKQLLGLGGRFESSAQSPDDVIFEAEGLNIRDTDENIFKRIYLSGGTSTRKKPDGITVLPGSSFGIHSGFTISVASSEDITDYREPNPTMANRLRNRFEATMQTFAKGLAATASCMRRK